MHQREPTPDDVAAARALLEDLPAGADERAAAWSTLLHRRQGPAEVVGLLEAALEEASQELLPSERRPLARAVAHFAAEQVERTCGREHPAWIVAASRVVDALADGGALPDAVQLAREALEPARGEGGLVELEASLRLGSLLFSSGAYDDALPCCERALGLAGELEGQDSVKHQALQAAGLARLFCGQWERGLSAFDAARALNAPSGLMAFFASAGQRVRMPPMSSIGGASEVSRAIDDLRFSLDFGSLASPASLSNLYRLAAALARRGQRDDEGLVRARADKWLSALLGTPSGAEDAMTAARYLTDNDEHAEAARLLERARGAELDDEPRLELEYALALALQQAGQRQEAADVLASVCEGMGSDHPGAFPAGQARGALLLELGQAEEARVCFEALAEAAAPFGELAVAACKTGVAHALSALERHDDALALFDQLAALLEREGQLASEIGASVVEGQLALLLRRRDERALAAQRRMLEATSARLGEQHRAVWLEQANLGAVHGELGQLEEARRVLEEVLPAQDLAFGASSSDALKTRLNLVRALRGLGVDDEAERQEALLREHGPNAVELVPFKPK